MALRLQAPANADPEGKDRTYRPVRVGPDSGGTPPIGVFDSGLGGLTAARELAAMLPGEDILYFGDTGRVPYGSRGPEVIRRYARQDAAFLLGQGVKALVCACGTVSSVAGEELARRAGCPFIEVVGPAALAAQKATRTGRVGVIGAHPVLGKKKTRLRFHGLHIAVQRLFVPGPARLLQSPDKIFHRFAVVRVLLLQLIARLFQFCEHPSVRSGMKWFDSRLARLLWDKTI